MKDIIVAPNVIRSIQLTRKFRPYQQGSLDCLCGVYAMVNSVKYLRGIGNYTSYQKLITKILCHLKSNGRVPLLVRLTNDGTWLSEIASVYKQVIGPQYNIKRAKPYHHNPETTIEHFIRHCQGFLQQYPDKSIILMGIGGAHEHWTLVYAITDTRLLLHDSSNLKYLGRSYCCLPTDKVQNTHILYPTHTYFLWVE